ncbi:hypothetical protein [Nocardia noduli]|uniref:hypothetical protein n=1 Tax=Nocardia noduli TaxID=2815722 RepID=UPI001C21888E|nr:hypothetical protein [Nocardia noduli]
MDPGQIHYLTRLISDSLSSGIAAAGFVDEDLDDNRGRLWFRRENGARPYTMQRVSARIAQRRDGGVVISGHTYLVSALIGEFARELSPEAQLDLEPIDRDFLDCVEHVGFGSLARPQNTALVFPVSDADGLASGVGKFLRYVSGPVSKWFSERDSIDKLIGLARVPTPRTNPENIRPDRLRGTVVLCLTQGRPGAAAALMHWYLERGRFNVMDSFERASAFDAALSERFPEYAAARGH